MKFPNKEQVEQVRKMYPQGARVELVRMDDPYTNISGPRYRACEYVFGERGANGGVRDGIL